MAPLSEEFWNDKYLEKSTGWDLGSISPPLKAYFDKLEDKQMSILIPGCGRAYEAEYLFNNGFENVHIVDFAEAPLNEFSLRVPKFAKSNIHKCDFFKHDGKYDLIVEQTLFCAIDPSLRKDYVSKATELLKPSGKLIGLLFGIEMGEEPPFGGTRKEYLRLFKKKFKDVSIEPCQNSVQPRQGRELFIKIGIQL